MTIGQHMYNGMGAAAWVLGFLILFAGTLIAIFLIVYGVILLASAGENAAKRKEAVQRAGTKYAHPQPSGNAQAVGRHLRRGL